MAYDATERGYAPGYEDVVVDSANPTRPLPLRAAPAKPQPYVPTSFAEGDPKNLLRALIHHTDVPQHHRDQNLQRVNEAYDRKLFFWGRSDDDTLYRFIRKFAVDYPGASVDFTTLDSAFPDRVDTLEVWSRVQQLKTVRYVTVDNVPHAVSELVEDNANLQISRKLSEAKELLNRRGTKQKVAEALQAALAYTTTTTQKGLKHGGVDEIFAPRGPIPWICQGLRLAPGGRPLMFAGYGFSGKTLLLQYMELCFATGRPIFGLFPVRQCRVLHLDYEQGQRLTDERFERLARGMNITKADIGDNLRRVIFPDLALDVRQAGEVLRATLEEAPGFDLLVADSYRASCPATDENKSTARIPIDMVNALCGNRTLPCFIHHANKPQMGKPQKGKFSLRTSLPYPVVTS